MEQDFCSLPENAKITFGSGGSKAIIAILEDKVYKYFPVIYQENREEDVNYIVNKLIYEIEVNKLLTSKLVTTKKTPHIIEFKALYKCDSKVKLFDECIFTKPSIVDQLLNRVQKVDKSKKLPEQCRFLSRGYFSHYEKLMPVMELEKADMDLNQFLNELNSSPSQEWSYIEKVLNVLLFQIFYTLATICLEYPDFVHGDLFIRNILVKKIEKSDTYIRYKYKHLSFDVPNMGFLVKFNDFGYTQINQRMNNKYLDKKKILFNPYKDYFNILYDLYDGQNLGAKSLTNIFTNEIMEIQKVGFFEGINSFLSKPLVKKNARQERFDALFPYYEPKKNGSFEGIRNLFTKKVKVITQESANMIKNIDSYFSNFMNVDFLKQVKELDTKYIIDSVWDATKEQEFIDIMKLKTREEYLEHFLSIFPSKLSNKNKVIDTYIA